MMDKVHKPQPTFWRERRAEAVSNQGPSTYKPNSNTLPLGQTGSQCDTVDSVAQRI